MQVNIRQIEDEPGLITNSRIYLLRRLQKYAQRYEIIQLELPSFVLIEALRKNRNIGLQVTEVQVNAIIERQSS